MSDADLQDGAFYGPGHQFFMAFLARTAGVGVGNRPAVFGVGNRRPGPGNGAASVFRRPGAGGFAVRGTNALAALDQGKTPGAIDKDGLAEFFLNPPKLRELNRRPRRNFAEGRLKEVLEANHEPLVSTDFNHSAASSVFDATQTAVIEGTFVRVLAWYDNEWGFSNRMSDTAILLGSLG